MKRTHIASSTPSRTRVKLSQKRRNPHEMERIAHALREHTHVRDVRANMQTGSIVIEHAQKDGTLDEIVAVLQDLGVVLGEITDVPFVEGKSGTAADLSNALTDLNERVAKATDGVVDLRILMPAGLGALAIHQLIRNGWQFETVPWYVLAWYSFDSFIKLHYTQDPAKKKG